MELNAIFSLDRRYRYLLTREWDKSLQRVTYIMLNPSTASENTEDQTSKQCLFFAKKFGFGSLEVVNLYSLISTDPKGLKTLMIDPIGEETDKYILQSALNADRVIIAWGEKYFFNRRNKVVIEMLKNQGIELFCLKKAKSGHPRHPSRLEHEINELIRY